MLNISTETNKGRHMKKTQMKWFGVVAAVGALALAGCSPKSDSSAAGAGEKAGAAVDRAAEKTKAGAEKAVDKTGEALERAGENMQE
jgi:hypothetical protein